MLTPSSGNLVTIGRFQGYQKPYILTVVLRPKGYRSTNHLYFPGFSCRFPEDSIYDILGMFPRYQDESGGPPFFITDTI